MSYQGMSPEQVQPQREADWRACEREAFLRAAGDVAHRIHLAEHPDPVTARAWRRAGAPVAELLADLCSAQRATEREGVHADSRDGDAVLAAWVEALRAPRNKARDALQACSEGDPRIGGLVRRANAYTAAIKALVAAGEAAIAAERDDICQGQEHG